MIVMFVYGTFVALFFMCVYFYNVTFCTINKDTELKVKARYEGVLVYYIYKRFFKYFWFRLRGFNGGKLYRYYDILEAENKLEELKSFIKLLKEHD